MGKVGVYGCCGREWGSKLHGFVVAPIRVQIDEEGSSIIAACEICAPDLSVTRIAELAMDAYNASTRAMPIEEMDARLGLGCAPQLAEPTAVLSAWVHRQHAAGVH